MDPVPVPGRTSAKESMMPLGDHNGQARGHMLQMVLTP